jgi:hypothetical protein
MGRAPRDEPSLEQVVLDIKRIRVKRFFSLSDSQLEELASKHETMLPFLYELYRRYGEVMDDRMRSAVAIYLLSHDADFEKVYGSLSGDAKNRDEILREMSRGEKAVAYN